MSVESAIYAAQMKLKNNENDIEWNVYIAKSNPS